MRPPQRRRPPPLHLRRSLPTVLGLLKSLFPGQSPGRVQSLFRYCASETSISMSVRTEMYNCRFGGSRDYLSVGQSPVPSLSAAFAVAYAAFFAFWIYLTLYRNRLAAQRIHHLMAGLLLTKALNLVFAAEDQHQILQTGTPHGWDVFSYIFQFLKGVLLFTVIVLIGTGWSFLKPFLQERKKKVLIIVIPLQLIANITSSSTLLAAAPSSLLLRHPLPNHLAHRISAGDFQD